MKKPAKRIPHIARALLPSTAVASGLFAPAAVAGPGDLDPTFGSGLGLSAGLPLAGPARSVQPLPTGDILFAGGAECAAFYYCSYYDTGFVGHLSSDGSLKDKAAADLLAHTEVLDFALQPDGRVIAVGRTVRDPYTAQRSFTVFRLEPGGSLDTTFATGGILQFKDGKAAQSVALEPNGNIVVAGSGGGKLLVLRLLPNGALDGSFGSAGVFSGQRHDDYSQTHVVRTAAGAYRVLTNYYDDPSQTSHCRVIGLTATGAMDVAFGASGVTVLDPPSGASSYCESMATQSDGRLLLAGQKAGDGFTTRLLAGGGPDPSFAASQLPPAMAYPTALAVDASGEILVAGGPQSGVAGAVFVRLHASGALDEFFGNAGTAWVDLPSTVGRSPVIYNMSLMADGRVLAAGGYTSVEGVSQPVMVRLLGLDGVSGPGVVGAMQPSVAVQEGETATVTVRRLGGATGEVSVAYKTTDYKGYGSPATSGQDYSPVSGRLTWSDGDRSDRQITVAVAADGGPAEEPEQFLVTLVDAQGGVGLGTQDAVIEIGADGTPAGQFGFADDTADGSLGSVQLWVNRNFYSRGAVSVTVIPKAGSTTVSGYGTAPITLSWADGDSESKMVQIATGKVSVSGKDGTFSVDLTNATNGAVLGPHSEVTVTVRDFGGNGGGGGGGAFDWVALLCLSAVGWLRRRAL